MRKYTGARKTQRLSCSTNIHLVAPTPIIEFPTALLGRAQEVLPRVGRRIPEGRVVPCVRAHTIYRGGGVPPPLHASHRRGRHLHRFVGVRARAHGRIPTTSGILGALPFVLPPTSVHRHFHRGRRWSIGRLRSRSDSFWQQYAGFIRPIPHAGTYPAFPLVLATAHIVPRTPVVRVIR